MSESTPNPKYYIVLDFEANCSQSQSKDHEIIEFPAQLVDASTGEVLDVFREFVRPTNNPTVSEFIHGLTGIEQTSVDDADEFPEVLARFMEWIGDRATDSVFVTCGHWDLKTMMPQQCKWSGISIPPLFKSWINLKLEFAAKCYRPVRGSPLGMAGMIHAAGLELEGRHHSGIDDVKNITRVLEHMIREGKLAKPTVHTLA